MGYLRTGRILRVNLTDRTVASESIEPYESFVGGKGVNLKLLFDGVGSDTDPLSPNNLLIFGVGPLVGTPFWGACRTDVMGKSPVTGHYGNSGLGGYLGAELKFAGYDNVVIAGRAETPVYLHITDKQVEIRDASALWGADTYETPGRIRADLGNDKAQVVCIGPAGENQAVYAAIMSGTGNAAARTGLGAVMGSKKLKAVAVHGRQGIGVAQPKEYIKQCRQLLGDVRKARLYDELHQYGLTRIHDREMRGAYRLLGTQWADGETISEEAFIKEHLHRRVGCFSCPVACFDGYKIADSGTGTAKCSPYGDLSWDLRNADLMVFWRVYVDCQRYGLDARSLSNAIAWLMTLHEQGLITAADTDGIAMEWGRPEAILPMAKKVSYREGIGDLLAGGLPAAAEKIGRDAADYLLMSKRSPSDLHVVPVKTITLASAVSPIGEDAQIQPFIGYASAQKYLKADDEASFQEAIERYKARTEREVGSREAADPRLTDGKAALVWREEERTHIMDMVGVCGWVTGFTGLPVDAEIVARFLTLGLGRDVSSGDLKFAAARVHHLERAFIGKCGLTRKDDRVSQTYFNRLRPHGAPMPEISCNENELERMKDDYYQLMGWSPDTGLPNRELMEKYDLQTEAEQLEL